MRSFGFISAHSIRPPLEVQFIELVSSHRLDSGNDVAQTSIFQVGKLCEGRGHPPTLSRTDLSEIVRTQSRFLSDLRQNPRTQLLGIVKRKRVIRPSALLHDFV